MQLLGLHSCRDSNMFRHKFEYLETNDGLVYTTLLECHVKPVLDFYFDVYLEDEPAVQSLGGCSGKPHYILQTVEHCLLRDGASLIVVDPNNNYKVVGISLGKVFYRDRIKPPATIEWYRQFYPEWFSRILTWRDQILHPNFLWSLNPFASRMYEIAALGVHPNYRGCGIATKLVQTSLSIASQGSYCQGAFAVASSDFSRKIFEKIGMKSMIAKGWPDFTLYEKPLFGDVSSSICTVHYTPLLNTALY